MTTVPRMPPAAPGTRVAFRSLSARGCLGVAVAGCAPLVTETPTVEVLDFTATPDPDRFFVVTLAAALADPHPLAFTCTADDDPEEVLLGETSASGTQSVVLRGLAGARAYTCSVRARDGAVLAGQTTRPYATPTPPANLPDLVATGAGPLAGGPYTLFNA